MKRIEKIKYLKDKLTLLNGVTIIIGFANWILGNTNV